MKKKEINETKNGQNKKLKELNATSKKGKTATATTTAASGARTRNMVKTKLRGPTPPTMDIMCNNNKNQFKPTTKRAA